MYQVLFENVPQLIRGALATELSSRPEVVVVEGESDPQHPFVLVVGVLGDDISGWQAINGDAPANRVGVVVLTDHHHMAAYRKAYRAGAAVAFIDSTPAAAVDVIVARTRGEIVVPSGVLVACMETDSGTVLSSAERTVLSFLSEGLTVAETAQRTFYSDRHVRRLLQSILAKAGTADRTAAISHFRHEIERRESSR